jgi:type 1 glutamine amidotransferase
VLENTGLFIVDVSTSPTNKAASAEEWAKWRPQFNKYAVVLNNFNGGHRPADTHWPREVEQAFEEYVNNGGGVVMFHAANNAFLNWPVYNEMIGLGWRPPTFGPSLIISDDEKIVQVPQGQGLNPGHGREHNFLMTVLDLDHPITKGMPKKWMHPHEQLTHGQHGPAKDLHILTYAWSKDVNENEPLDWVKLHGKGRVYTTMLGHLWANGEDTAIRCVGFQTLLIRGTEWAATGRVTYPTPADFPTANEIRTRPITVSNN